MAKLSKVNVYLVLIILCLTIATGCLTAGYIFAGYWQIVLLLPILLILWLLANKQSIYLSASIFLLGYVILAAVGILLDFSVGLMVFACVAALASWELLLFDQSNIDNLPDNSDFLRKKYHLTSLVIAISVGLILAIISANINLHIPFAIISLLVLVSMGCLIYSVQFVVGKKY